MGSRKRKKRRKNRERERERRKRGAGNKRKKSEAWPYDEMRTVGEDRRIEGNWDKREDTKIKMRLSWVLHAKKAVSERDQSPAAAGLASRDREDVQKGCAAMISGPSRFRLILLNRGGRSSSLDAVPSWWWPGPKAFFLCAFIFSLILRRAWLFPYFVVCCCVSCAVFYAEDQGKLWGRSSWKNSNRAL